MSWVMPRCSDRISDYEALVRQMPVDPVVECSELVVGCLQSQGCAVLSLSTGTLKEDNQMTGDGKRPALVLT